MRITIVFLLFFLLNSAHLFSQSFGIRAGLNMNTFVGPKEVSYERNQYTRGFHFGVNYGYKFSEKLVLRFEAQYTQIGNKYSLTGDGYYRVPIVRPGSPIRPQAFSFEKGYTEMQLKVSNAYINFPITLGFQVNKKIELVGGVNIGYLIGPRGSGVIYFEQSDRLFFKQSLTHNYNTDVARGASSNVIGAQVYVGDFVTALMKNAGAYYNYNSSEKIGRLYNPIDIGVTAGFNYFVTKGLYFGVRWNYGLLDITNNKMDMLRTSYDEVNNLMLPSNHFDRNFGFEGSFGFRF